MRYAATVLFIALASLLPACNWGEGGSSGGGAGAAPGSGAGEFIDEVEGNDTPATAHDIGDIGPGTSFIISGNVAPGDIFDGFQMTALEAMVVTLFLSPAASPDLDIIFTDENGVTKSLFADILPAEVGTITVAEGEIFQLVVLYFSGVQAVNYNFSITGTSALTKVDEPFAVLDAEIVEQSRVVIHEVKVGGQRHSETVIMQPLLGPTAIEPEGTENGTGNGKGSSLAELYHSQLDN
jgi:hypothetical protein